MSTFPSLCRYDSDCEKLIGIFGPDPDGPLPTVFKCGASIDFGVKAGGVNDIDGVKQNESILFDLVNFNSLGNAMLTIFQVLTLENWTDGMMYVYMDASGYYISVIYFVSLVIFGSFFILNLVLAQIVVSFDQEKQAERDIKDEEDTKRDKSLFKNLRDVLAKSRNRTTKDLQSDLNQLTPAVNQHNLPQAMKKTKSIDITKEQFTEHKKAKVDIDSTIDETPDETEARKRSH